MAKICKFPVCCKLIVVQLDELFTRINWDLFPLITFYILSWFLCSSLILFVSFLFSIIFYLTSLWKSGTVVLLASYLVIGTAVIDLALLRDTRLARFAFSSYQSRLSRLFESHALSSTATIVHKHSQLLSPPLAFTCLSPHLIFSYLQGVCRLKNALQQLIFFL